MKVGSLCLQRNLPISSKLSHLQTSCSYYPFPFLLVCVESLMMFPLSLLMLVICVFPLILRIRLTRDILILFDLFKEPTFGFIDFLTVFLSYFINFHFDLYFLPSANFGLICSLFLKVEAEVTNLRPLFFTNTGIQCYKFPPNHCLTVSHKF